MPITLIQAFGKAYSQFGAQTNIFGAAVESREQVLEQQDANECFLVFLHLLEKLQTDASVFKDHPTVIIEFLTKSSILYHLCHFSPFQSHLVMIAVGILSIVSLEEG